jgi:hypothetical protein
VKTDSWKSFGVQWNKISNPNSQIRTEREHFVKLSHASERIADWRSCCRKRPALAPAEIENQRRHDGWDTGKIGQRFCLKTDGSCWVTQTRRKRPIDYKGILWSGAQGRHARIQLNQ